MRQIEKNICSCSYSLGAKCFCFCYKMKLVGTRNCPIFLPLAFYWKRDSFGKQNLGLLLCPAARLCPTWVPWEQKPPVSLSRCQPAAHRLPGATEQDTKRKGIWRTAVCKCLLDGLVPVIDAAKLLGGPRAQIRHKYLLLREPLCFAGSGLCQRVGVLLVIKSWLWKLISFPCEDSKKHEHAVGHARKLPPSGKELLAAPCIQRCFFLSFCAVQYNYF